MSQEVFRKMKTYHKQTGKVLSGGKFVIEIVNKYPSEDVVDGLLLFNQYLDELRKGESA